MKNREYQLVELERARKLQAECIALHLPSPPVLHWNFEVKSPSGELLETGRGKANSYTRNALNLLAWQIGFAADDSEGATFEDGVITSKATNESIGSAHNSLRTTNTNPPYILVGENTSSESLDSYAYISNECSTNISTSFNATTRILTSVLTGVYQNTSGSEKSITEAGIILRRGSLSSWMIMVRDVFDAISLPNGSTITWVYTTEIAYPNP